MSAVEFTTWSEPRFAVAGAGPVALLDVDAGFAAAIPPEDRLLARRVVIAARHFVPPGRWLPAAGLPGHRRPFAALLLGGVLVQEVLLTDRLSAQLVGPGDVFRPWETAETALPCAMRWSSSGGATIAVIDDRFLLAARRWPELFVALHDRLNDQLDSAARRTAICGLARVEDRVLALFWHLADRWGVVRPEGIVVRLSLTHKLIGRLVAAKRPTVSLALTALAADGHLTRDGAQDWVLAHDSADAFRRGVQPA